MTSSVHYLDVAQELDRVCANCGRSASDITLVAVSKTVDVDAVQIACAQGAVHFGENRPDQLMLKADTFPRMNWHFIGNIQSRRIKDIVGRATLIHSLFERSHATKIDQIAAERDLIQDVLLEVNVSGEASKSGLNPHQVEELLQHCCDLSHIRVRGLMTMAPQGNTDVARATFEGLAQLMQKLRPHLETADAAVFTELSMGMTDDWPEAVAAGATIVRIGRAIFAP